VHESQTEFELTLAKLVLLQLFAPELYRFGKQKMANFLSQVEVWAEDDDWQSDSFLENIAKKPELGSSSFSDVQLERQIQPLVRAWIAARHNRSGFDPDKLINLSKRCDQSIKRYFLMLDEAFVEPRERVATSVTATYDIKSELPESMIPDAQGQFGQFIQRGISDEESELESQVASNLLPPDLDERAMPDDPLLFLDGLFSGDVLQIRGAIEQEKERLQGRAFAPEFFERLLRRVEKQPEIVDVNWLQALEPYLSFRQLSRLYEQTGLLERLAGEVRE